MLREAGRDRPSAARSGRACQGRSTRVERKLLASRWGILYPSSIVLDAKGTAYVGMRGAVARLAPIAGGYEEQWLLSPRAPQ